MMFFSICKGRQPREEVEQVEQVETRSMLLDSALAQASRAMKESNPPTWPASVHVIEPDGKFVGDKQELFDNIFSDGGKYSVHPWGAEFPNTDRYGGYFNETGRDFCAKRTVVLLKPGVHRAKFNVGFYNSLMGLGRDPGAVEIDAFEVLNGVGADGVQHSLCPGALDNFWRSVENVTTAQGRSIYYFVSQASPLRKVHIRGELRLSGPVGGGIYDWGYASGGFAADSKVDGGVEFGGQQQFITRNSEVLAGCVYKHGAWSNVLVGSKGEYQHEQNQLARVTEVPCTERIAEKPYIMFEEAENKYFLMVPQPEHNKKGVSWERYADDSATHKIDFENVYVADAETATAATINAKIAEGKAIVLTPGVYKISEPIIVSRSGTVILGLGMATVMPAQEAQWMDSLIFVKDNLQDIRIAAVLLEAGSRGSDALLKWGTRRDSTGANTGFLYDIFCRVGGDRDASMPEVMTNTMIQINSSNVVGDNLWLWRADHEGPRNIGVTHSRNKVWNALQVNGDNVTIYGLFAEHALHDQVVWNGENGKTFFFQCELPYDVTQQNFGDAGYSGYVIGDHVKEHDLRGAGVYTFFRDFDVHASSGFRAPEDANGIRLQNIFCVFLDGQGGIDHVLNGKGTRTGSDSQGRPNYIC